MLRLIFLGIRSAFFVIRHMNICNHMMKHPERYSELDKYREIQKINDRLRRNSRTTTEVFGTEKLPEKGPYVLYANHQGHYDGLGVLIYHEKPVTIIIDAKHDNKYMVKQMLPMVEGRVINLKDPRQQMKTLVGITEDLKKGKIYLIFPEGKYGDNKNTLQEFKSGVFKCALDAKVPIVPVTLIDSYKAFDGNSLKKVKTQIHYLDPIPYEEFKDMKKNEIADMVKERIQATLDKFTGGNL